MDALSAPPVLRPLVVFAVIALCLSLSSCQCAWKPDVGPVDEEDAQVWAPAASEAAPQARLLRALC